MNSSVTDGTPLGELRNRVANRFRHIGKWARRQGISAFRVYDRDIADQPLRVEWYDGLAVCWAFERTRNETPEQDAAWVESAAHAVAGGLGIARDAVVVKRRHRQEDRQHGGQYQPEAAPAIERVVTEHGLRFRVDLGGHIDTGLFLDHRPMRAWVGANSAGKRVCNLFAYTGAFTVHARAGGAVASTTVDLSQNYLAWATANSALNGQNDDPAHTYERQDARRWLEHAVIARRHFDLIVCDPPTFSNSAAMRDDFSVDRDHAALLWRCWNILAPGGTLLFSTNSRRFQLAEQGLPPMVGLERPDRGEVTKQSVPEDCPNRPHRCWRWGKR